MSRFRLGLVGAAIIVPFFLSLAGANGLVALSEPQDDADSGADAPDTFEEGLRVAPGTYDGTLRGLSGAAQSSVGLPVGDEDYYRIWMEKGVGFHVRLENLGAHEDVPGSGLLLENADLPTAEILTPQEEHAGFLSTFSPGDADEFTMPTSESGWWGVRVLAFGGSVDYRLTLEMGDLPDALVHQGAGYAVAGFQVPPGGSGLLTAQASLQIPTRSFVVQAVLITPEFALGIGIISQSGAVTVVQAGPARADVHVSVDVDNGFGKIQVGQEFVEPGTYYFVAWSEIPQTYMWATWALEGNASLLGTHEEGAEALRDVKASDFDQGLGAVTPGARAAAGLSKEMDFRHSIVGLYECDGDVAQCSYTGPQGESGLLGGGEFAFFQGGSPGRWEFRRDQELSLFQGEDYHLIAADVELPVGPGN